MEAEMAIFVTVPISTEVIESNPDCKIRGSYENGALVMTVDTREQNHHKRLGLGTKIPLHWEKEHQYEAQELSATLWPMRYRVLSRHGYYLNEQNGRTHFTTNAAGIDSHRHVSQVLMRAAILLVVVGGVGYRRAAWLLKMLFHVQVSKSALQRWIEEIAAELPSSEDIIYLLNERNPITEAHFDEIFPRGMGHCVLVIKDEHGRILATKKVDKRDEQTVKPFLAWFKMQGLALQSFYIDGCQAYYNAIRAVFGQTIRIQYDYFHIIQNVWRHLWKWAVFHRRKIKARSQEVITPWHKKKLESLAKRLWENRYLLFKADGRMTPQERERLTEVVAADQKIGDLRSFLSGVWSIFTDSHNEEDAKVALGKLKLQSVDRDKPEPFKKAIQFLEQHFDWMTTYLQNEGMRRNSLAETGMRTLRRLEVEHDGFRSDKGRENCLRIYQAVKYLGWSVYRSPP
jgi:hypothetical protein